jgi:hypothetical protein
MATCEQPHARCISTRTIVATTYPIPFSTDDDAIRKLTITLFSFKHNYLADTAHRSMVRASKEERYRALSPFNKRYYRAVAKNMQDILNWQHDIDSDCDTEDIGEKILSDMG